MFLDAFVAPCGALFCILFAPCGDVWVYFLVPAGLFGCIFVSSLRGVLYVLLGTHVRLGSILCFIDVLVD